MRPISDQFYEDDEDDEGGEGGEGDKTGRSEASDSSDFFSSEDETAMSELKVCGFSMPMSFPALMLPQRLQIENAKLAAENRTLKSTDTSKLGRTFNPTSSTTAKANPDQLLHCEYRGVGKRFAVLSDLWVQHSILRKPCPPRFQPLDPWDSRRCADDAAWDEGNIVELYFLLPKSYHELIERSALFSKMVSRLNFSNLPTISTFQSFSRVSSRCESTSSTPCGRMPPQSSLSSL